MVDCCLPTLYRVLHDGRPVSGAGGRFRTCQFGHGVGASTINFIHSDRRRGVLWPVCGLKKLPCLCFITSPPVLPRSARADHFGCLAVRRSGWRPAASAHGTPHCPDAHTTALRCGIRQAWQRHGACDSGGRQRGCTRRRADETGETGPRAAGQSTNEATCPRHADAGGR